MTATSEKEQEPFPTEEGEEGGEGEEGEEGEEGGEGGEGEEGEEGSAPNAKQKKKKKSKAAAKLRKKLGLTSNESSAAAAVSSGKGKQEGPILTDEEVTQLQQAIEKEQGPRAASKADRATLEKLMKMMNLEKTALLKDQEAKQKQHKAITDHKFWKTQPVTKPDDAPLRSSAEEGPIEPNQPPHLVKQEPYPLPADFEWVTVDIDDAEQVR